MHDGEFGNTAQQKNFQHFQQSELVADSHLEWPFLRRVPKVREKSPWKYTIYSYHEILVQESHPSLDLMKRMEQILAIN